MIKDIFVPSKIGSYYIFHKRVLGFEITTSGVYASLIYFTKKTVIVENSMHIALQDYNPTAIINAIKKIVAAIGSYDEIVTSLPSSTVIFKELVLPFIGREKIEMIVNYEVEPLLPFSLEQAAIDFLITDENKEKFQTTILVAAVRLQDLDEYKSYFEKAGVVLATITLDLFALYDFYRHAMYVAQAYTSLLLVDFGVDAIKILYIQKGVLKSVRLIPYGLTSMMKTTMQSKDHLSEHIKFDMFLSEHKWNNESEYHECIEQILNDLSKQLQLSLSFFQKQIKNFIAPSKIICLGVGTQLPGFIEKLTNIFLIPIEYFDIQRIAVKNNIQIAKKVKIDAEQVTSFMTSLVSTHYGDINFLAYEQRSVEMYKVNKQLCIGFFISIATIIALYFYSNYQMQQWDIAYNKSKKEVVTILQEHMEIDAKNIKRIGDIVALAENKLQQTKKVCFSFSQSNHAFLHYLEELCSKIDRVSLKINMKKMSINDKEIILQGRIDDSDKQVDPWKLLTVFQEELMELKSFTLKDRPRELAFTVTLLIKDNKDTHEE